MLLKNTSSIQPDYNIFLQNTHRHMCLLKTCLCTLTFAPCVSGNIKKQKIITKLHTYTYIRAHTLTHTQTHTHTHTHTLYVLSFNKNITIFLKINRECVHFKINT
jgi:hypothetical protein